MVTLQFKLDSDEKLAHILQAEDELNQAGIHFDTGFDFESDTREWRIDWSLKGADVK
jgi:hypothetical protein